MSHDHEHGPGCSCGCGHDHSDDEAFAVPRKQHNPDCFAASQQVAAEVEESEVVHAWIHSGSAWILHAWAEVGGMVRDLTESHFDIDKDEYYTHFKVEDARLRRYSRLEYFTQMAEKGTLGPFDTELFFGVISDADPLDQL